MSSLKRYLIELIVLLTLIFLYFMYTAGGQSNFYKLISYAASNKAGIGIDIQSLDLSDYPYVRADILADEVYHVQLYGYLSKMWSERQFDFNYTIDAQKLKNKDIKVKSLVQLKGRLKGKRRYTELTGSGSILDGNTSYAFIKEKKVFKNVSLILQDINSSKLLKVLDQKVIFRGLANANLYFEHIGKKSKRGTITYEVTDKDFHGHVTDFNASVAIEDKQHTFAIDMMMPSLALHIYKGKYHQEKKEGHALYTLDIKDLSVFRKELGSKYTGAFYASGEIEQGKQMKIKGFSKSLKGLLEFEYDKTLLQLNLIDIPLASILQRMGHEVSLESNTTGTIHYNVKKREMDAQVVFTGTTIIPSKFTQSMAKTLNYDIANEVFPKSHMNAQLKEGKLSSEIIFSNDKHHLVLKNTKIAIDKKIIDTTIDLKTPTHFLEGHLQARLDAYITHDYYVQFDGLAQKHYKVTLDGLVNNKLINMDYTVKAQRFSSHVCTIEDNVSIKGHVNGPFKRLRIRGEGTVLDGSVRYDAIKVGDTLEDVNIQLQHIHALKLSTLLGEGDLPSGKADVSAKFIHISKKHYQGVLDYSLEQASYKSLPLKVEARAEVNTDSQTFTGTVYLGDTVIDLSKGTRDANKSTYRAFFTVNTKDLTQLEEVLGEKYIGPFYAVGEVVYDKKLQIKGLTNTYGGMIDFFYNEDKLTLDLNEASLKKILLLFAQKPLLDASTIGTINYDYKAKVLLVGTKLKNAKFQHTNVVDSVYAKSGVNLLREVFTDSTLNARYSNKVLEGNIYLKSPTAVFVLSSINVNNHTKVVNAFFDFNMQEQEFTGKIYGSIDEPKVNLNMKKLLKYQMNKQLDTYMGKGNREMMENIPMGGMAKDIATDMGGGFMDMFF